MVGAADPFEDSCSKAVSPGAVLILIGISSKRYGPLLNAAFLFNPQFLKLNTPSSNERINSLPLTLGIFVVATLSF